MAALNEYGPIRRIALRHARDAFRGREAAESQWRALGYKAAPDFDAAVAEYDRFAEIIADSGAEVVFLSDGAGLSLDSIYLRDALIVGPGGTVLCNMGKAARAGEPAAAGRALAERGLPVMGAVEGAGRIEGGDLVWLDEATCAVGLTYRTNAEGVRQLRDILGPGVTVETVDLPHYKGPDDVFHLMSILSPLDRDLALVHSPLMPVGFRRWLLDRGIAFVETAQAEFEAKGCNVLALAPRRCLALEGAPETRRRLEAAGCEVLTYRGREISNKGDGGPTCLARPLERG
jgi:N-dimethylarginine dimethylaminohydrolase